MTKKLTIAKIKDNMSNSRRSAIALHFYLNMVGPSTVFKYEPLFIIEVG